MSFSANSLSVTAPSRRSKQTLGNGQFAPKSPPCQRELQRQRWQYRIAIPVLDVQIQALLPEKEVF
jgi:hypothetical protein